MTLRQKLLLLIGCVVAALVLILELVSKQLLLASSLKIETQLIERNVEQAVSALSAELSAMDRIAADWAAWDDTCQFMEDQNADYIKSNLVDDTYRQLRLNLILFFNPAGKLVYGRVADLISGELSEPSSLILYPVCFDNVLLRHESPTNSVSGFVVFADGPMMVVSRPIVTSNNEGPVRGVLVVGRYLDGGEIRSLSERTCLTLGVTPQSGAREAFSPPAGRRFEGAMTPVVVRPSGHHAVSGYTVLPDVFGKPSLQLAVTTNRDVYQHSIASLRYIMLWILVIGIVVTVVTAWALDRFVLSSLSGSVLRLRDGIRKLASSDPHRPQRIETEGEDELVQLAFAINDMLRVLESEHRKGEEQQQEIYQANKLAALGTLVSGIAHEINNPNNIVSLNSSILEQFFQAAIPILDEHHRQDPDFRIRGRPYAEVRAELPCLLTEIRGASDRISRLVDGLKSFARRDAGAFTDYVEINLVAQTAVTLVRHSLEKATSRFSAAYADGLPRIRGNAQRLEQVIVNLLQNACQALTDKGLSVSLTTRLSEDGKSAIVQIRDEGRGIPRENLERISDPFFTTRRQEGGTGLGLSVSFDIVKQHGGSMEFESEVGKGTTVTVALPVEDDHERSESTVPAGRDPARG